MSEKIRIDCNLDTILFYTLKRLVDEAVCNSTTGFIGQNPDDNWVPPSNGYCIVSGRNQALLNAETRTWAGVVTVRSYAFSNLDIGMRDFINLTQRAGAGVQAATNRVIGALDMWDMNNGGIYYLAYPMRVSTQDDPKRTLVKGVQGQGWSFCDLAFDIVYGESPTFYGPQVNGVNEFSSGFSAGFM